MILNGTYLSLTEHEYFVFMLPYFRPSPVHPPDSALLFLIARQRLFQNVVFVGEDLGQEQESHESQTVAAVVNPSLQNWVKQAPVQKNIQMLVEV